jgi:uncharacterized paraquat-inducible protein A
MGSADSWSRRDLQDHEYPEPDDADDDASETVPCPKCGAEVYEEAEQCPRCGEYITAGSQLWSNRSWWWIILGGLGIAAVLASCLLI